MQSALASPGSPNYTCCYNQRAVHHLKICGLLIKSSSVKVEGFLSECHWRTCSMETGPEVFLFDALKVSGGRRRAMLSLCSSVLLFDVVLKFFLL
ncbi:hypothetical protein ILYODFUR_005597 [Ilyodon furcidens]|uniref:Uncharacterized protein n=1 Tax=Ilyodon furcidens TaxID=33524 RepID=A0ABV0TG93_9TELE